ELTAEPCAEPRGKSSCQQYDRCGVPVSGSFAAASSRTPSPQAATASQPRRCVRYIVPIARPSSNVPSRRLTVPSIPRRTPVRRPPDCCSSSVTVPPDGWYRYVPVRSCADAPSAPARKSPSVIVELMMNEPALPLPFGSGCVPSAYASAVFDVGCMAASRFFRSLFPLYARQWREGSRGVRVPVSWRRDSGVRLPDLVASRLAEGTPIPRRLAPDRRAFVRLERCHLTPVALRHLFSDAALQGRCAYRGWRQGSWQQG